MRIGLQLALDDAPATAAGADRVGIAAVVVPAGPQGTGVAVAAAVAAATRDIRIVTTVTLGTEHPVTLAEEVAVVDHLSAGRVVALVERGDLTVEEADEDLAVLRAAWSGRWLRHAGPRWTVPAGLHGEQSPESIAVTPAPAQLSLPVWVDGGSAALAERRGLPVLLDDVARLAAVPAEEATPVRAAITGDLDADRALVQALAAAGVSHAILAVPAGVDLEQHVARHLVPEAAMPGFPRIVAESAWPARWPV